MSPRGGWVTGWNRWRIVWSGEPGMTGGGATPAGMGGGGAAGGAIGGAGGAGGFMLPIRTGCWIAGGAMLESPNAICVELIPWRTGA